MTPVLAILLGAAAIAASVLAIARAHRRSARLAERVNARFEAVFAMRDRPRKPALRLIEGGATGTADRRGKASPTPDLGISP